MKRERGHVGMLTWGPEDTRAGGPEGTRAREAVQRCKLERCSCAKVQKLDTRVSSREY